MLMHNSKKQTTIILVIVRVAYKENASKFKGKKSLTVELDSLLKRMMNLKMLWLVFFLQFKMFENTIFTIYSLRLLLILPL